MIKVNIKVKDNIINEIRIIGHANYKQHGKDIICASVSSIAITTVNGILSINPKAIDYIQDDEQLIIKVRETSDIINILLTNMINLLKELANDYQKHIKIEG